MDDKDILRFDDDDDDDEVDEVVKEEPAPVAPSKPKIKPTSSVNRPKASGSSHRRNLIDTDTTDDDILPEPKAVNKPELKKAPEDNDILDFGETEQEETKTTAKTPKAKGLIKPTIHEPEEDNDVADERTYEVYNDTLVADSYIKELEEKEKKRMEKIKTPEQKRKRIFIAAGAAAVFVGVLVILNIRQSNKMNHGVDYATIDLGEYDHAKQYKDHTMGMINGDENSDGLNVDDIDPSILEGSAEAQPGNTTPVETGTPVETDIPAETGTPTEETTKPTTTTHVDTKKLNIKRNTSELNVGEYVAIPKTEEVKLNKDDDKYSKIDSEYYFGVSTITSGYDAVERSIKAYNDLPETKTIVKVPEKSALESENITLVEIDVDIRYPEDYPTNLSKGDLGKISEPTIEIVGTFEAAKKDTEDTTGDDEEPTEPIDFTKCIVVNGESYSIEDPIQLFNKPGVVNINKGFTYRYIMQLPIGANPEDYELYVELDGTRVNVNTVAITK